MSSSVEALHRGDLQEALAALQDEVRAEPAEPRHRVFLFQLLSVLGDWNRALTQLNVARDLDPNSLLMAQTYQEVLSCEVLRKEVFTGKRSPVILGEPEPWMAKAVEALRRASEGEYVAACELRDEAWADAPTTAGSIWLNKTDGSDSSVESGIDFDWLADCDTRLGPFLEVIVDGKYYWAPFHRIEKIGIEAPTDLRDCVWMPAQFMWANQGQAVGMIPTRYPASESHENPEIRLARTSEWHEPADGVLQGFGQRVLAADIGEFAIMDVRKIELRPEAAA